MSATPEVLPQAPAGNQPITPVNSLERIQTIDILRGFALFGVLVANMKGFSIPIQAYFGGRGEWPLSHLDTIVDTFIVFIIKGKSIALFSFLFGLGMSVQFSRAEARGVNLVRTYCRRLLVLLAFGTAHYLLFWAGDILHNYALLGFALLLFRNTSLKWLARSMLIWFVAMMVVAAGAGAYFFTHLAGPQNKNQIKSQINVAMQEQAAVYQHGNYKEQVALRWRDWKGSSVSPGGLFTFVDLFLIFLMGLYAGRRRVFQEVEANRDFIRKMMWCGLIVGGVNSAAVFLPRMDNLRWLAPLQGAAIHFWGQFLFIFYAGGLILLIHGRNPVWRTWLNHLAPVGRMALTNYLSQTLICTTIFYDYGLGFFGKMGSAVGLLLSIGIFAIQILASAWWLRHFEFGPAEWLWRSLTYGKLQPMRITKPAFAAAAGA